MHTKCFYKPVSISLLSLLVVGCSATPEQFVLNSSSFGDTTVCRHLKHDGKRIPALSALPKETEEYQYLNALANEIVRRDLNGAKCADLIYQASVTSLGGLQNSINPGEHMRLNYNQYSRNN